MYIYHWWITGHTTHFNVYIKLQKSRFCIYGLYAKHLRMSETQNYRVTISHLIQLTSASSKRQTSSSVLTKGPPTIMIELQDSESKSHVCPGVTIMISASLVRFTEQSTPPNPLLHAHTPGKQITIHILSIVEAHEMVFVFFFHHPGNCWDLFCCNLSVGIPFDLVRKNSEKYNLILSPLYTAIRPSFDYA